MKALVDKWLKNGAPDLDLEDQQLEQLRLQIESQLESCRSRIESIDLLASNEKPDDCIVLFRQLLSDFTNLSVTLNKVSLLNEAQICEMAVERIRLQLEGFSEVSSKKFWKSLTELIEYVDRTVSKISKTVTNAFSGVLATALTIHRRQQKKRFAKWVSIGLIIFVIIYQIYGEMTRAENKLQSKVLQAYTVLHEFGLEPEKSKIEELYREDRQSTDRLTALVMNRALLFKHFSENGSYPIASSWLKSCGSKKPWITGLSGNAHIDPGSDGNCELTFLYKSNGNAFKLLMQGATQSIRSRIPAMSDPVRQDAAGFWSKDARNW